MKNVQFTDEQGRIYNTEDLTDEQVEAFLKGLMDNADEVVRRRILNLVLADHKRIQDQERRSRYMASYRPSQRAQSLDESPEDFFSDVDWDKL